MYINVTNQHFSVYEYTVTIDGKKLKKKSRKEDYIRRDNVEYSC